MTCELSKEKIKKFNLMNIEYNDSSYKIFIFNYGKGVQYLYYVDYILL